MVPSSHTADAHLDRMLEEEEEEEEEEEDEGSQGLAHLERFTFTLESLSVETPKERAAV